MSELKDPTRRTDTEGIGPVLRLERVRLEVVSGPDVGASLEFVDRVRIGSRKVAQMVLSDTRVSGLHCEVVMRDGLWVQDLGSKNGTFLGGFRIREAEVPPGTTFTVGRTSLRVRATGELSELPLLEGSTFHGVTVGAPRMRALAARMERVAGTQSTVLITGETGVGKDRWVQALHSASPRATGPLVVVDCGAVPPGLIESEFFGHAKGAFTGATQSMPGAFARARGGTLFLDEVGELPLDVQTRLLRALSGGEIRPLGGGEAFLPDVRVVAATHRDLALEVSRGRFREDLYHRLAVITLEIPPLRERLEELPQIAVELLKELGAEATSVLTPEVLREFAAYTWPGNVRELRNALERAATLQEMPRLQGRGPSHTVSELSFQVDLAVPISEGRARLADVYEATYVRALLDACAGNVSEAARRAGVDRMTLHRMVQRHQLRKKRTETP
jgi:DNA-binding NtrC family response regulator